MPSRSTVRHAASGSRTGLALVAGAESTRSGRPGSSATRSLETAIDRSGDRLERGGLGHRPQAQEVAEQLRCRSFEARRGSKARLRARRSAPRTDVGAREAQRQLAAKPVITSAVVEEVLLELIEDQQQNAGQPRAVCVRARSSSENVVDAASPARQPRRRRVRIVRAGSPCQASTSTIARGLPPVGMPWAVTEARQRPARSSELFPRRSAVHHRQSGREEVCDDEVALGSATEEQLGVALAVRGQSEVRRRPPGRWPLRWHGAIAQPRAQLLHVAQSSAS